MDKIKVSSELGKAIESVLDYAEGDKNFLLVTHKVNGKWNHKELQLLNDLSHYQLAEILIKGYEIEITKEERALLMYEENHNIACTTSKVQTQWYSNGFNDGMKYMNEQFNLGLKLKTFQ